MIKLFYIIFLLTAISVNAQVAINTDGTSPVNSAMLDVRSTEKGFLPPRMTTAQRNTIASPEEGLVIYNTNEKALNVYNGTEWSSMKPVFPCGLSISINHQVSGGIAPVDKSVTYGTVNGIPGEPEKCWITSNLGADHQAASVDEASEASAGWYWQFNRKQGYKHDGLTRTPNTAWITSITENSDWIAANDPCALELGTGWRIPANSEWTNIDVSGGWNIWNGPWDSDLKLHAAGFLDATEGMLILRGLFGYYWSNLQSIPENGWYFYFSNVYSSTLFYGYKPHGMTIRCLRDF
jgi:hypothetical protein